MFADIIDPIRYTYFPCPINIIFYQPKNSDPNSLIYQHLLALSFVRGAGKLVEEVVIEVRELRTAERINLRSQFTV